MIDAQPPRLNVLYFTWLTFSSSVSSLKKGMTMSLTLSDKFLKEWEFSIRPIFAQHVVFLVTLDATNFARYHHLLHDGIQQAAQWRAWKARTKTRCRPWNTLPQNLATEGLTLSKPFEQVVLVVTKLGQLCETKIRLGLNSNLWNELQDIQLWHGGPSCSIYVFWQTLDVAIRE